MAVPGITISPGAAWGKAPYNGGRGTRDNPWLEVARQFQEANLRMRARAGNVWIVVVDNCFPENIRVTAPAGVIDCNGNWACKAEPLSARLFVHTITL